MLVSCMDASDCRLEIVNRFHLSSPDSTAAVRFLRAWEPSSAVVEVRSNRVRETLPRFKTVFGIMPD